MTDNRATNPERGRGVWSPWLREDGLTDGDKLLIGAAPRMASMICRMNDAIYFPDARDGEVEQWGESQDLHDLAEYLLKIGAEV